MRAKIPGFGMLYALLGLVLFPAMLAMLALWVAWLLPVGKGYDCLTITEMRRKTRA